MALRNLGIEHEVVAISEFDKYADVSWKEIQTMVYAGYKEGSVRTELIRKVHEEENIYKYRGAIR